MGIRSGIKRGISAVTVSPYRRLFSSHYTLGGKMTTKGRVAATKKFVSKNKGKIAAAGASAGVGVGGYYAYRKSRTAGKK